MYKKKKEKEQVEKIPEDEKEVNEKFEKVEKEDMKDEICAILFMLGMGVTVGATAGSFGILCGCCIALPPILYETFSNNKYYNVKKAYLADNLKLVRKNKYHQMIIEEQEKQILTEEQKEKLMLSMATLAYVSTDNYSDFDRYYKEKMGEILGSEYKDNIEDALIRHRIYLTSDDRDEFRENLKNEYDKTSLKSDNKILAKKK